MNLKTTIALLLLAGGTAALFWKGPEIGRSLGISPPAPPETAPAAAGVIDGLKPGDVSAIRVQPPDADPVELSAPAPGKPLELPGNWPARAQEVDTLVRTVAGLQTRFAPIVVGEDGLKPFGLDPAQKPIEVEIKAGEKSHRLLFGQPEAKPDENPFTRPTFVQVDGKSEVLRLGPDVIDTLAHPADYYRKRQIFPEVTRLKVADSAPSRTSTPGETPQVASGLVTIPAEKITRISATGPAGQYAIARNEPLPTPKPPPEAPSADAFVTTTQLADVWHLDYPVRDRVDPAKLKTLLSAIPDLWVERFVQPHPVTGRVAQLIPDWVLGDAAGDTWLTDVAGLSGPDVLELEVQGTGSSRRLLVGKVSRSTTRTEAAPPPMIPGQPPQPPRIVTEEFRYAKLADNPLVFEVKADKLKDIFVSTESSPFGPPPPGAVEELRDPNLVRFETDRVKQLEIKRPGKPALVLKNSWGDPQAKTPEGRRDRWDVTSPFAALAETNQVTDLIRPFDNLQARKGDIIDRQPLQAIVGGLAGADLAIFDLNAAEATRVQITTDSKEMTLLIGRHDPVKKKLFVRVAGWERINIVDDNVLSQLDRPATAYRSLKLFDLGDDRVASVSVVGRKGEKFELQEVPGLTTTWKLTAPVQADADNDRAKNIARDLGELQVQEYVHQLTKDEIAAQALAIGSAAVRVEDFAPKMYGLKSDALTVTIRFAGPKDMTEQSLTIGKQREGKSDYYARAGDENRGVFTISKSIVEDLEKGSLGLLPLQLWQGDAANVKSIEITHSSEPPFTLQQEGGSWKITAPLQASVDAALIRPLASALASVKAERYEAHSAPDLAAFGLKPPVLRIKFRMSEKKPPLAGEEPKEEVKERVLLIGGPDPKFEAKKDSVPPKKDDPFKKDEPTPGRFAKLEGDEHPAIFVVPGSLYREANKSLLDLLDRKLLSVSAQAITKLQSTGPEGSITLTKDGTTWKPEGAAFNVDKPTVDSLLQLVANLSAARFADFGDSVAWAKYGLDDKSKPATLTVSLGNETHKVELGKPVDEKDPKGQRFARVDAGKGVAVLSANTAEDLSKGKLDFVDRSLLKFDLLDLQTIRRSMGKNELELKQGATGGWEITKPTAQRGDAERLEDLATRLASLRGERIAAVDVKDLKPYGLDAPAAVIKLELAGDKSSEKILKLGKPVDDKSPDGERFAQIEGSTTVAVLPAALSRRLVAEPVTFRDRTLASFVNADKIVIEYDQPTGPRQVTFTKGAGGWKLTAPVAADAEDEALREVHDALARLKADELVADKPGDLKPYGLDKPKAKWKLYSGDKELLSLVVGAREKISDKKDQDGVRVYAKLEKGDMVVLLDRMLTIKLAAEYRKRSLWDSLDVAGANEIRVLSDGSSFTLTKGAIGWTDPAKPLDRINTQTVTDFLDAIASLKAEHWVVDKGADLKLFGLSPPQKTITVSTQTGQKRTLLLGRLDESKRAYAKLDDKDRTDVFLLSEHDTSRINLDRAGFGVKEEPKKEPAKKEVGKKDNAKDGKKDPAKKNELKVEPRAKEK